VRETSLQTQRSVKKGRRRCSRHLLEIPLQPMVKTVVTLVVPLQPMEVCSGTDIHLAKHEGLQNGAGGCALKQDVTPWRAHARADSQQQLWPVKSPCWRKFSGRTYDPVGDPCRRSLFLKDCTL